MVRSAAALSLLWLAAGCSDAVRSPAADRDEATADAADPPRSEADGAGPVLAELYTSQGCSSCPPADALLSSLVAEPGNPEVIALAFHVDYWNDLGWRDVFSAAEWSQRQRRYARSLATGRVYTPMLVIDGTTHMVGSREKTVRRALAEAASRDKRSLNGQARVAGNVLSIRVHLDAGEDASIYVAAVEGERSTVVERGENAGRRLPYTNIVRALTRAKEAGAEGEAEAQIAIDADWRTGGLSAVAFAQRKSDGRVVAVARLALE